MGVRTALRCAAALAAAVLLPAAPSAAQSRLPAYPGYERHQEIGTKIGASVVSAAIRPDWSDDSAGFTYRFDDETYRFDVAGGAAALQSEPEEAAAETAPAGEGAQATRPQLVLARGRGGEVEAVSPDEAWTAFTREGNLYLKRGEDDEIALTADGGDEARVRNGQATYVYVEELAMGPAVWWSPDSRKLAYLRFDESQVEDYFLALNQTEDRSQVHTQAYPAPGGANPVPDLFVYDLEARTTTRMDVRSGADFSDDVIGHYVWAVDWTADSSEVLMRRSARDQKRIELAACAPESGVCRTVVAEDQPQSWASVSSPVFLEDGRRFIWRSERSGFANFYLYDLSGRLLATLTDHAFDVDGVEKVDEARGEVWYMARGGDNYLKQQLRRVRLDGTGDVLLTDPAFHHTVSVSPDASWFVDIAQTHKTAPVARLMTRDGEARAIVAESDLAEFEKLGLRPVEQFSYLAADGESRLLGQLHFPSNFDASRRYPLLISVYGGPDTNGARETFITPSALTEYGFIFMQLDLRTARGRGRAARDAIYKNFGVVEIDDLAAAVRQVGERPYIDADRVGVYGTSYGGYAAALAILRYPEVFAAALANSPVTDYRLYDSTYTERYLGLPQENPEVYDAASAMTYAANLKGDLMIYYGSSDDNVHPKNALSLIQALQAAGKRFEVQVGPDRGHTSVSTERMMEFFIESLVLRPGA